MSELIQKLESWLDRNDIVFLIMTGLFFGAMLVIVIAMAFLDPEALNSLDGLAADSQ